jgi:hypothetical protein
MDIKHENEVIFMPKRKQHYEGGEEKIYTYRSIHYIISETKVHRPVFNYLSLILKSQIAGINFSLYSLVWR